MVSETRARADATAAAELKVGAEAEAVVGTAAEKLTTVVAAAWPVKRSKVRRGGVAT